MATLAIPNWTPEGVLPPINPVSPTATDRSPYMVSLTDFVLRFSTTPVRREILKGLLDFRKALHQVNLVQGFQWVDGSFLENIETTEDRDPRDIDVVTFFQLPAGQTQSDLLGLSPRLWDPRQTKQDYKVDAYFVQLDSSTPEPLMDRSVYWYSMWSHRRDGRWKGYLRIDLSPAEDLVAQTNLEQGGRP